VSLAQRRRKARADSPSGGIPGLRNPIIAREIDKLELNTDNSYRLMKLRDELGRTLAKIHVESRDLIGVLEAIRNKYGKDLPPFLYSNIGNRMDAASILLNWLDGKFPGSLVRVLIEEEEDGIHADYIRSVAENSKIVRYKFIGHVFPPDASIQDIFDWFVQSREVFEELVKDIGPAAGVYLDELEFKSWLKDEQIDPADPYITKAQELFSKLYSDVEEFDQLIKEFRELVGWREEGGES
jgi:hypothetical protein